MSPITTIRPPDSHQFANPAESRELVQMLASTRLFAKYERSFSAASGLPLAIRPVESFQMPARSNKNENPFCALMAQSRKGCVACLQTQSELEASARARTRTIRCYANLHDTMVPIRIGQKVVAYLQTGQVALEPFGPDDFDRTHSELLIRGIEVNSKEARAAYFQSRCMPREVYNGFVKMLEIFAESLGSAANALVLTAKARKETGVVAKAIRHMERHFDQKITLTGIARVAGSSDRNFCKLFKAETGLTFVSYLTRLRVEQAMKALRESVRPVSEIAFACGFESIAQFNRSFRAVAGVAPREYRQNAMN